MYSDNIELCANNLSALHKSVHFHNTKLASLRVRLQWIQSQIQTLFMHLNTFASPKFLDDLSCTKQHLGNYITQYEEVQKEFCFREITLMHLSFKLCTLEMHKKTSSSCSSSKNKQGYMTQDTQRFICLDTLETTKGISKEVHDYLVKRGQPWYNESKTGFVNAFISIMKNIKTKQNGKRMWYEFETEGSEIHMFKVSCNKTSKKEKILTFFSNKQFDVDSSAFIAVNWLLQSDLFAFP